MMKRMKFYYGQTMEEAKSNEPVEIVDTEILKAYNNTYRFVIPEHFMKKKGG